MNAPLMPPLPALGQSAAAGGGADAATASSSSFFSHTVCRSPELLSCAKTAVKIAKKKHASDPPNQYNHNGGNAWWDVNLSDLQMHEWQPQLPQHLINPNHEILEDGLSLLRTMEAELQQLTMLVRRRGHSNDPTEEISISVRQLEEDTKELMSVIRTMVPATARGQYLRHWKMMQQWFQTAAQSQGTRLKQILKVRGAVLAEQAQRRKLFQASPTRNKAASKSAFNDNPLMQIKAPPVAAANRMLATPQQQLFHAPLSAPQPHAPMASATTTTNGTAMSSTATTAAPYSANAYAATSRSGPGANGGRSGGGGYYNYYGASPAGGAGGFGGGYGGSASNSSSYYGSGSGMRQRKAVATSADTQDSQQHQQQLEQEQLLVRQQERETQRRLQDARQAESSLAELGTLFSKMSSLITAQSETIVNIEDDVEAASFDVRAGHAEIQTLYTIKKGNRALILKVFGLLIFFIIFMRLYRY